MGNKSAMQRDFFKNSTDNLLPALRFLGRLYKFCKDYLNNIYTLPLNLQLCYGNFWHIAEGKPD